MQLLLQCASATNPVFKHPLHGASLPPKPDPFTSVSSRNSGFSVHSVPIHPWNRISSSAFRKWTQPFFSIDQLLRLTRVIPIFLIAFILEGEAYATPGPPPIYSCEDVQSYYASADHKKGEALRKALHVIVAGHRSLSYKAVWNALKILDASEVIDPGSSSGIVEIYTLRVVSKQLAGKPEGWNREHLWPRSYGLTKGPSLTDLHNIRPADANVNSSRGNKYFGECCNDSVDCLRPANKEAALDTEADKEKWAPPKQVRGDIARALMYMAVRYGFQEPGFPVLKLSDSPSTMQ